MEGNRARFGQIHPVITVDELKKAIKEVIQQQKTEMSIYNWDADLMEKLGIK